MYTSTIYDLHLNDLQFTSRRFTIYISTIYDLHLTIYDFYIKEL